MFDESTRIPLFIYHPQTPYAGQHYKDPVELVDVYPTVTDLLSLPYDHAKMCTGQKWQNMERVCHQLQGKSLARVVLGDDLHSQLVLSDSHHEQNKHRLVVAPGGPSSPTTTTRGRKLIVSTSVDIDPDTLYFNHDWNAFGIDPSIVGKYFHYPRGMMYTTSNFQNITINFDNNSTRSTLNSFSSRIFDSEFHRSGMVVDATERSLLESTGVSSSMPRLDMRFALSQSWRFTKVDLVKKAAAWVKEGRKHPRPRSQWFDCDKTLQPNDEVSLMGYSMRTNDFRYTSWYHYNRKLCLPIIDLAPYEEEVCVFVLLS